MSARDDLAIATDAARAQVRAAREALAASRDARSGDDARDAGQAERQITELRGAISDDLRVLRERVVGLDAAERRGAALASVAGIGALATLMSTGLAVRARVRRTLRTRDFEEQARILAAAMGRQAAEASGERSVRPRQGPRRSRAGVLLALTIGAAVAGATLSQQRRNAPVDPDDIWLPEHKSGPD